MAKTKTNKALAKRIKITGTQKFMRRSPGQNHFNAKDSGNIGTKKRRMHQLGGIAPQKIMRRLQLS